MFRTVSGGKVGTGRAHEQLGRPSVGGQPLLILFTALVVGAIVDRALDVPLSGSIILSLSSLAVWWMSRRAGLRRVTFLLILVAAASASAGRHHMWWHLFPDDEIGRVARTITRPVVARLTATTAARLRRTTPSTREPGQQVSTIIEGQLTAIRVSPSDGPGLTKTSFRWERASGRTRLSVRGSLPSVRAGDELEVKANLSRPSPPLNPGEFHYASFQRADRVLSHLRVDHVDGVRRVARGRRWGSFVLEEIRRRGKKDLERYVGPRRGPLATAMLLGNRRGLTDETTTTFMVTGTIHLLAISGLHVGMLVCGIWWLGRIGALSRRMMLLMAVLFVVGYAMLTEARPPVVRAAALVAVVCLARLLGRRALAINTLAAAGIQGHRIKVWINDSLLAFL